MEVPRLTGSPLPLQPLMVPRHRGDTEAQGPALVSRQAGSIPGGLSLGPVSLPCACSPCRAHSSSPGVPFPPSCGWVPWIHLLRAPPFTRNGAGGRSPASTWPGGADPTPNVSPPSPGDTIWAPSVLPHGVPGTLSHHPQLHFGRKMESKVSEGGLNVTLTIRLLMHGKVWAWGGGGCPRRGSVPNQASYNSK